MRQLSDERAIPVRLRCPECGPEIGSLPTDPQGAIGCDQCGFNIRWDHDCWDACVDKTYPRDFARQWVLWESGRLGDPNLIYGVTPEERFREVLNVTGFRPESLKSRRILEVGYGHGMLLRELQKWCPEAYGLDLAKPLPSARLRPGSAIFGNLFSMPFVPRQFDIVICRGVLHMTPDPPKAFNCVAEQVAPGGLLYVGGIYEPGKGNLVLRRVFPGSSRYPEFLRLALAYSFSPWRAMLDIIRSRNASWSEFRRLSSRYKLDLFDILCPRWTSVHTRQEILGWFNSQGFQCRKSDGWDHVGMKLEATKEAARELPLS